MLIGIEGDVGSGKTVLGVRYLKLDNQRGRKIFTNLELINMEYELFDIDKFLSNQDNDRLCDATILIDEITMYMDCRLGSSKQNLLMGYLVLQSRKRGIDIYYTTQNLDMCDYKRLVRYTKIFIYAQEIYIKDKLGNIESLEDWRNYTILDMRKRRENITQFNLYIKPFYSYYDTDQIIEPLVKWNKKKA